MSVAYRSTCRPTLGRYIDRDLSVNIASDISVDTAADMSVDMSTDTSRSTHRPRVGRHIGRASTDMSTDISVEMSTDISTEGFVNYTWSIIPCGESVPSWKINFCSRFLQLPVFPWCKDSPQIVNVVVVLSIGSPSVNVLVNALVGSNLFLNPFCLCWIRVGLSVGGSNCTSLV